ncbi:MAG: bifunctional (p)ppGpp synthetase/guanosine-3',5'-bis(diphosphate) 3'-pyrophosphohydrolase [Alphaproteobacteria bacterium]|nr:bifunctional (p)ppGpp synthetase/guanosine-3',5'-bis(diphosphate) 3'-pyrophosphohydrolase [Alphaproteobacteria bacterium]MBE8221045.1 bifunctional (p)ppGpp synthetase/guanosine-3',5'-bis(diphosphate) 3'-pyrophosphohydrolase [Alphaproteobacteria bacterium]
MMRQYELVDRVTDYAPHANEDLLNRAYVFATQKHGDQKRASGDPYFSHPIEVAGILTDLRLDTASIATALLHDTIEDTDTDYEEIESLFGEEIAKLVDGVTKLSRLELSSEGSAHAENFRKLLLATAEDIRILLVKLADRLHNMRTLYFIPSEAKRRRIAEETLDIYAPLAGRIGMQNFREELEDLSFSHINPQARDLIKDRLASLQKNSGTQLDDISYTFYNLLAEHDIRAHVVGRQKSPFSIWRKMQSKSISLEQLSDIFGYRIIVENEDDCYRALGVLHRQYNYVQGRYKDYISTPKLNGYRSLHTTIIGPDNKRVEVQIRDKQMESVAENGIAAHWWYKDLGDGHIGELFDTTPASPDMETIEPFQWLRDMVAQIRRGGTAEEFLENTKLELFNDQVFCFTPKGRLISLPHGATALDFAYAVHTQIGNSCVGARINGRKLPLRTTLNNGDEIEIIRADDAAPRETWLHQVKTGKAKSAIRHYLREGEAATYAGLGKRMVYNSFESEGETCNPTLLERALGVMDFDNLESLYAAIGRGDVSATNVLQAVLPEHKIQKSDKRRGLAGAVRSLIGRGKGEDIQGDPSSVVLPVGAGRYGSAIRFAPDHFPLPQDKIVGITTAGAGLIVYPASSPALDEYSDTPERWVQMRWDMDNISRERLFQGRLLVSVINRTGSLSAITQTFADFGANIANLSITQRNDDFCDLIIDIEVRDVPHVSKLIDVLKGSSVISSIERITSPQQE